MDIIDGSGLWLGGTNAPPPSDTDILFFHRPRLDVVYSLGGHSIIVRVVSFVFFMLGLGA